MSIHAVAQHAGVSITTVSRVFNRPERVAPVTRKRVLRSARLLGFTPNASARALRTQRSRIVGVVLPTLLNPVFAECLDGIAESADAAGYAIVPLVTQYRVDREAAAIDRLIARDVDGLIVTVANASRSRSLARLQRRGSSYVLAYNRHPRHPCVSVDGETAFAQVVQRLIELGHHRIAMASGTLAASDRARQRYRGFQQGLSRAGLPRGEPIEMPFVEATVRELCERLVSADRPTALLCSNDLLAVRCIRGAHLAGLRVPEDLSVVGFDGIALGEDLTPQLTTVVQPNRFIGQSCVGVLVDALRNGVRPAPKDSLSLLFVVRDGKSCAGPGDPATRDPATRVSTTLPATSGSILSPLPNNPHLNLNRSRQ